MERRPKHSCFMKMRRAGFIESFLINWSTYGQKKKDKLGRHQNLFGKANKYLVDIVDDGLMTAVRKMKKIKS